MSMIQRQTFIVTSRHGDYFGLYAGIVFINLQWDLTLDQRYTLSENTVEIVEGVKQPL